MPSVGVRLALRILATALIVIMIIFNNYFRLASIGTKDKV